MAGVNALLIAGVVSVVLMAASCQGQGQGPPELLSSACPPENPFCPVWVPCNYTEVQGPTCQDCKTRVICTPVGGLVRPCVWPLRPHCVDGKCSAEPSEACAAPPTEPEPPTTPAAEDTEAPEAA